MNGYKGYANPDGSPARFREAACWAHLRWDFHHVWQSTKPEIAREALDRIGALYDIERDITGRTAEARLAARQELTKPLVEGLLRLVRGTTAPPPRQE